MLVLNNKHAWQTFFNQEANLTNRYQMKKKSIYSYSDLEILGTLKTLHKWFYEFGFSQAFIIAFCDYF